MAIPTYVGVFGGDEVALPARLGAALDGERLEAALDGEAGFCGDLLAASSTGV